MRTRAIALSSRGIFEPIISEEDVIGQGRALLKANGARFFRIVERIPRRDVFRRIRGRCSERGLPDTFGWIRANRTLWNVKECSGVEVSMMTPFFIEWKRPGGVVRPAQKQWIDDARNDGMVAFIADSVESMVRGFAEFGISIRGVQS